MPADPTPAAILARAEEVLRERRSAQVEDLELVLAWADVHTGDPQQEPSAAPISRGGDRLVRIGGDGTPEIQDLSLEELSIARQTHVHSTRSATADALDLRHRLPQVWAAVKELRCEVWLARKVASMSRKLDRDAVRTVDAAVAAAVHQSPGRVLTIAEAKIVEADTAAHDAEVAENRRKRGVWVGGTRGDAEGAGLRTVYARVASADAVWVDATVERVADLLAADADLRRKHHPDLPEKPTKDELRAVALGWLARPHDLAELLRVIDEQTPEQRRRRRRRAVVYVHLHESALLGAEAVARAEAIGPVLTSHLAELLGHSNIDLRPVIDLNGGTSVSCYEHPAAVKERTHLRTVGDVFPYAASTSRTVDHDHPTPYDPGGPPGQTGDHNDAPLGRHHHRAKTHRRYQVCQLGLGRYLWRSPHGLVRLVNSTGTHAMSPGESRLASLLFQT